MCNGVRTYEQLMALAEKQVQLWEKDTSRFGMRTPPMTPSDRRLLVFQFAEAIVAGERVVLEKVGN